MWDELYGAILCFVSVVYLRFKMSPHLIHLLGRMPQHRLALKLQICFLNYDPSPEFKSAWGQVDNY